MASTEIRNRRRTLRYQLMQPLFVVTHAARLCPGSFAGTRPAAGREASVRRLPGPADHGLSDGGNSQGSHRFVSGLAENTNSIFCADSSES
jgi:hypothetical protein